MDKVKRILTMLLCACLMATMLFGCGSKNYEKKLAASWYVEGESTPSFTLYDDGTCKIDNEYGIGTWSVANDNQLRITNYYGETLVVTIVSVKDGCLTIEAENGYVGQLWDSAKLD